MVAVEQFLLADGVVYTHLAVAVLLACVEYWVVGVDLHVLVVGDADLAAVRVYHCY